MTPKIDEKFLIEILTGMVKINSVNPGLVPNAPGEKEIVEYIAHHLSQIGIETVIDEIDNNRYNVTGVIKGSGDGKSLMFNGHTDTVSVEKMENPFSAEISDGKLYGRGSYDMKGGLAAMLTAAKALVESKIELKGDLVLAFVADEEYDSKGTEKLLEKIITDGAIVTEPSDLNVCIGHRGFGLFEITTTGKVAHGGRPDEGIDANMQMGKVLNELKHLSDELNNMEPNPLLGKPSLHVPVINGGTEPFTYSGECKITVEWRSVPGDTSKEVLDKLHKIIQKLSDEDEKFNASIKKVMWRDPFETNKSNEIVKCLAGSVKNVTGKEPNYIGHNWWEDSGLIGEQGIDTVIIGPEGAGLHTENEWVEINSVLMLSEILLKTAVEYCNIEIKK